MTAKPSLVIASKSPWDPPIRREHQLARLAMTSDHLVSFIQPPADVRALRGSDARRWMSQLIGPPQPRRHDGLELVGRATLAPAHVHRWLEPLETRSLARAIPQASAPRPTIVATLPWQWPGVASARGYRRVLDVADDWSVLLPHRSRRILELYKRAAGEADAITVVSDVLHELFPERTVQTVRNGLDSALLDRPLSAPPRAQRLLYVGTLSERFDSVLAGALLDELPDWRLDLYGTCAYARRGTQPGDDLVGLLQRSDGRATWRGPAARIRLAGILDSADVLLLPNRPLSRGQDSMKIYDYAARGRPVVATDASLEGVSERPPHIRSGSTPNELAAHVRDTLDEPVHLRDDRVAWARAQTWEARWPDWADQLFAS